MKVTRIGTILAIASCFVQPVSKPLVAQPSSPVPTQTTLPPQSLDPCLKAVVKIVAQTGSGQLQGSGFIVAPEGIVVTNLHVVKDASHIAVKLKDGDAYEVTKVLGLDPLRDIVLLRIAGFNLPTLALGDSADIPTGTRVLAIGHPLGEYDFTVSDGIVSGNRQLEDGFSVIQTTASASPGNSGGPIITDDCKVIAVMTWKDVRGESLNFGIPINYVRGLLSNTQPAGLDVLASKRETVTQLLGASGPKPDDPLAGVWTQVGSGMTYKAWTSAGKLYLECTQGGSCLFELSRAGDDFSGSGEYSETCEYRSNMYLAYHGIGPKENSCTFKTTIKLHAAGADRLEGSYTRVRSWACKKCVPESTEQASVVFIRKP